MAKAIKTIKVKIHNPNSGKEEALSQTVSILIPIEKKVDVKPIEKQKKENPNLTTLSVDMSIKHIAVITVRKNGKIVFVKFFRSEAIEVHRLQKTGKKAPAFMQNPTPAFGLTRGDELPNILMSRGFNPTPS